MRLIDADANIETMKKCATNPENEQALLCYRFAQRILEEAPTVDAEPVRHGEWVKMRGMMPPEYMGLKECNKCGWHIHPLGQTAFDKRESEFRYCPRCGAKMNNQFANGGKMEEKQCD